MDSADVFLPAAGVLFDCDGVLVDSDASVASAWSRWALEYGLDPALVREMVHGRRAADTVALLIDADRAAVALDDINTFEVQDAVSVRAVPGALELTSTMDGSWAVVTSGTRLLATARLAAAGLPSPPILITADDVNDGKPAPEGYLAAASRLGLAPQQTVVVEDALSGAAAARAAGVAALVGVGPRALETDAELVVPDLAQVRWSGGGLIVAASALLRPPRRPLL